METPPNQATASLHQVIVLGYVTPHPFGRDCRSAVSPFWPGRFGIENPVDEGEIQCRSGSGSGRLTLACKQYAWRGLLVMQSLIDALLGDLCQHDI